MRSQEWCSGSNPWEAIFGGSHILSVGQVGLIFGSPDARLESQRVCADYHITRFVLAGVSPRPWAMGKPTDLCAPMVPEADAARQSGDVVLWRSRRILGR
jgi:hypothetical protein